MTTYTIDDLFNLNKPDLIQLTPKVIQFFKSLAEKSSQLKKDTKSHYPNRNNIFFHPRKMRITIIACQDPDIIKKIRSILGKITPHNYDSLKDQLVEFLHNCKKEKVSLPQIALLLYGNIIDNIKLVDIYVKLLIELEPIFPNIIYHIHESIVKQINTPQNFDKDTFTETAVDKIKRWTISNSLLLTHIYLKGKYTSKFYNSILRNWLNTTTPDNLIGIEIIAKLIPFLNKKHFETDVLEKLITIFNDKSYPARLRFLIDLKDK
jgi:hypothetical protein